MPTYEYKCADCGKTWEVEKKISETPEENCPECKSVKTQRLISSNSFILKGDNWANKEGY